MEKTIKIQDKIRSILETSNIEYKYITHDEGISAEDMVNIRKGYTLSEGSKSLILCIGDKFIQLVITGDSKFSNSKVRSFFKVSNIRFASEKELGEITGGIKRGGVPPFGNLFGLEVYVDKKVFENKRLVFNCGLRTESIAMSTKDYKKVVNPKVIDIV